MERAGYLQQTRSRAYDSEGVVHDIVELHILGNRYAMRRSDLVKAISGRIYVQVEELTRNWGEYLVLARGLAQVSASGRALNIDLFGIGRFTLSLATLRAVLYGKEKSVAIVRVPETPAYRFHRTSESQQTISALS